jgi:hypothetical protein
VLIREVGQDGKADVVLDKAQRLLRLAGHQFQWFAAQQSRDNRHLALNGKTLRAISVKRPQGRLRRFGGALRRRFGLAPVIIRDVEYSG